jgi:hypothetical protein
MKLSRKIIICCFALLVGFGLWPLSHVLADDGSSAMTDQQIELIRSNCVSTKNTLNQLHVSDALLRVNRGQLYESLSTKLMDRFNNRVASNKLSSTDLASQTTDYRQALDKFRADYITYEQQLSTTIGIDCSKQPVDFYDAVANSRTKRNQVHDDVVKLNSIIGLYQSAVDKFEADFQKAEIEVKGNDK